MVVVELTCFTWSLANISLSLPFLAREGIEDNFQFGRSIDLHHVQREDSRRPRTVDEASMFLEVFSNLVRSTFDTPISTHVSADLCAPLIVLLPLFFVPNLLPWPKDNPVPSAVESPSTSPPTLLAQYTIRPDPPLPPSFWQPHRNMTGLTQNQDFFQGDATWPSKPTVEEEVIWSTFEPDDNLDWDSEEEESELGPPASEDVVNRPLLGYGLPRVKGAVKRPSLGYGTPLAESIVNRPSLVYGTPRVTKDLEKGQHTDQKDSTVRIGPKLPPSHTLAHLDGLPEDKTGPTGYDTRQGLRQEEDVHSVRTRVPTRPRQDKYRVFGAPRTPDGQFSEDENRRGSPQRVTLESLHNEDYDQTNDPFDESQNLYNSLWERREGGPGEEEKRSGSSQLTRYGAQLKRTLGEAPLRQNKVWRRKRLTD